LSEKDRKTVSQLGAILRLADALDNGYENRIKDIKFKRGAQSSTLKLISNEDCTAELKAVELKKDLFESAFGTKLTASAEMVKIKK
jgi:hypothetical protein